MKGIEFKVIPFGLSNTPTFQSMMENLFQPYMQQFVLVFFDDILIYSPSKVEHQTHSYKVFKVLS